MAVTGVFTADFSNFDKAVHQSEAALQGLETAGGKVSSSLRLMTQQQDALLDSIGAAGGRVGDLGEEAEGTAGQVGTLSESYRQFDGVLSAAGVNIGPQVKGLEDLAGAAGKTATELGVLGTAGLVAGAAFTGWKIGQWIDDLTGLSTAVANVGGALDTLAAMEAGAKQDTINRAIAQGAKETISYTAAIQFNADQVQINADKSINWAGVLADAQREVRALTTAQRDEIAIAVEAGATTEQLTNKYGISAQALGILADKTDEATAAQAKLNAERQKELDATARRQADNQKGIELMERDARLAEDRAKFDAEQLEITNKKLAAGKGWVAQMSETARATREATEAEAAYLEEQAALDAENGKLIASLGGVAEAHTAAGAAAEAGAGLAVAGYQGVATQMELTADGVRAWLQLMQYTAEVNAQLSRNGLFTSGSTYENIARIGVPSFASGVQNFEGGLAKVHGGEVLANLAPGTSVFPKGSGFGNVQMSNTFNLVDSESNLARRVSELIMRQVRAGTQLGTS
jgi:hypothetical protein